jgi:hypothetical protein
MSRSTAVGLVGYAFANDDVERRLRAATLLATEATICADVVRAWLQALDLV